LTDREGKFHTPTVILVSIAHMVHDTYPAFLAPLLPLLQVKLGLSYTMAGGLAAFLRSSFLLQPVIGFWADRRNIRAFVIVAPATTALFMSAIGAAPSYTILVLLLICAGISHAAFHAPAPALMMRISGARPGRGMSFFMTGGEFGRAVGPVLIGSVVVVVGLKWSILAAVPGLVISLLLVRLLRTVPGETLQPKEMKLGKIMGARLGLFVRLLLLMSIRCFMIGSVTIFLPGLLTSRGITVFAAAGALSLFELAGAGGALAAGTWSDLVGIRRVLLLAHIATPPFLLALTWSHGWATAFLLIPAGIAILSTGPVLLTLSQQVLPEARGTAGGLYFGVNQLLAALSSLGFGVLIDAIGIQPAFVVASVVPLLGLPLLLGFPALPIEKDGPGLHA
jgi:FSR family fosmidomycin resistance protein-like MFS transporter